MKSKNLIYIILPLLFIFTSCTNTPKETYGSVIIINGPSAVGKTSIIKSFQSQQQKPWLNIGIDNFFIGVLPPKFYLEDKPEHHAIMRGIATEDDHGKLFTLHVGLEGYKIIQGMHQAIAAYLRAGNNVIVDYIMYENYWLKDLQKALADFNVTYVGITASLETLKKREAIRGTSPQGHARSLYKNVHHGWQYNLKINTDNITPEQAAESINKHIQTNQGA